MSKEELIEKPFPLAVSEKLASVNALLEAIGLDTKVSVELVTTKTGKEALKLFGPAKEHVVDPTAFEAILNGNIPLLFKHLENCFPGKADSTSSVELLWQKDFAAATFSRIPVGSVGKGNEILTELANKGSEVIPVIYGSTAGINFAEVLETIIAGEVAKQGLGKSTAVLFETVGNGSLLSYEMLTASERVIPESLKEDYEKFKDRLGTNFVAKRTAAANLILNNFFADFSLPTFISDGDLTAKLGPVYTVGKLMLLAKLAGGDPKPFLHSDLRASRWMSILSPEKLKVPVSQFNRSMAGFGYYARDAVIAAEIPGAVLLLLKMTTHANIYKILGRYGSLYNERTGNGAILAPIKRLRIQTAEQAKVNSDPADVIVLAFLAQHFPDRFAKLLADFVRLCTVMTPEEAIDWGTKDVRLVVEDYFKFN